MFSTTAAAGTKLNEGAGKIPSRGVSQSERMRAEMDRMFLIVEALWVLLKEKHGYSDDELTAKIVDLDLASGRLDNRRATREVGNCTKCKRRLMRNKKYCVYCGEIHLAGPFD